MKKKLIGTTPSAPVFLLVSVAILLFAGCAEKDSPVESDPPVIVDLDVWYVNASASGAGNGSSWADAFTAVQEAVDYASEGDEIWVAAGTYDSHVPGDPSVPVIRMKPLVDIYGGFSTIDVSLPDRDPDVNRTILDGENRTWHVVIGADFARLDGFTIMAGFAAGDFPDNCGGGMLNHRVSPVVENCVFTANDASFHGAGMANMFSSPVVRNCVFRINTAANNGAGVYNDDESGIDGHPRFENCVFGPANNCRFGGGMYNNWCEVTVTDCLFAANTANHNGGGMYNTSSRAVVTSCVFSENRGYDGGALYMNGIAGEDSTRVENCLVIGNRSYVGGGGIYLLRSASSLVNCTVTENVATYGGGISCWHSEADIANCIVWDNTGFYASSAIDIGTDVTPAVRYCDIDQDGYGMESDGSADADGNIRLDPLFTVGPLGGWYLEQTAAGQTADSPCVDAGTVTVLSAWLTGYMTTRTDGALDSGIIDMGFHYAP